MDLRKFAATIDEATAELNSLLHKLNAPSRFLPQLQDVMDTAISEGWDDVATHLSRAIAAMRVEQEAHDGR